MQPSCSYERYFGRERADWAPGGYHTCHKGHLGSLAPVFAGDLRFENDGGEGNKRAADGLAARKRWLGSVGLSLVTRLLPLEAKPTNLFPRIRQYCIGGAKEVFGAATGWSISLMVAAAVSCESDQIRSNPGLPSPCSWVRRLQEWAPKDVVRCLPMQVDGLRTQVSLESGLSMRGQTGFSRPGQGRSVDAFTQAHIVVHFLCVV